MTDNIATREKPKQQCLIIGMSHVEAIRKGIPEQDSGLAKLISLNEDTAVYDRAENTLHLNKLSKEDTSSVFLSIGGNFYNIFGLLENPHPISVSGTAKINSDKERALIPREMMKDHFRDRLDRLTQHIAPLTEHFPDSQIYHICSPPPIESAAHIEQYPGVFGKRLEMGVAPSGLRKNLYDLQTEIYREICQKLDIEFIDPPPESVDDSGFLKEDYLNKDPTHANQHYGALVWSQIKERTDG